MILSFILWWSWENKIYMYNLYYFTYQPAAVAPKSTSYFGENSELHPPARVPVSRLVEQPKPAPTNPPPEWKLPNLGNWHVSPEVQYVCFLFFYCLYLFPKIIFALVFFYSYVLFILCSSCYW